VLVRRPGYASASKDAAEQMRSATLNGSNDVSVMADVGHSIMALLARWSFETTARRLELHGTARLADAAIAVQDCSTEYYRR